MSEQEDSDEPTMGLELARAIARCLGIKRCVGLTLTMHRNKPATVMIIKHLTVGEMNAIHHEVERFKIDATPIVEELCEAVV